MKRVALVLLPIPLLALAGAGSAPPDLARIPMSAEDARETQKGWAAFLQMPVVETNGLGMKLVFIPPGRFTMGPNGSTYRVTLARAYFIGATEVTLGQYRKFKPGHVVDGAERAFNDDERPAAMVSWDEARAFCRWLSEQPEEKAAGRAYSLPTEAQWEWAARAGTATTRYLGDTDKELTDHAWFNHTYKPNPKAESGDRGRQPVGKLKPNAWGLSDVLGNVWEWCEDRKVDEVTGETRDPVMRGGSWRSGGFHCTAIAHDPGSPRQEADHIGFRVVCRVREPKKR